MPLRYPSGPIKGHALVAESVGGILSAQQKRGGAHQILANVRSGELQASAPHRVYVVTLENLVQGRLLGAAELVSWRYLLLQKGAAVGEVELTADPKGADERPRFKALHETRFSDATLKALVYAKSLRKVKTATYEVRFLKAPAVYFAGLWLHAKKDDLIIPLCDPPAPLEAGVAYAEKEIVAVLEPAATAARAFEEKANKGRRR